MKWMLDEWDSRHKRQKSHSHVDEITRRFLEWIEKFSKWKMTQRSSINIRVVRME